MNERMIELHLGGLSNVKVLGGKKVSLWFYCWLKTLNFITFENCIFFNEILKLWRFFVFFYTKFFFPLIGFDMFLYFKKGIEKIDDKRVSIWWESFLFI